MHVVPDTGAVGSGIVVSKDLELFLLELGRLEGQGNQVRFRPVILAEPGVRVGSGGVEVAEGHVTDPVGLGHAEQDLLRHQLGPPVGVDGGKGMVLVNGSLDGLPVDGGGG